MPFLQTQALRRTVDLKLYEELAERRGLVVTDQEVRIGLENRLRQYEVFLGQNGQLKPTSEITEILRDERHRAHPVGAGGPRSAADPEAHGAGRLPRSPWTRPGSTWRTGSRTRRSASSSPPCARIPPPWPIPATAPWRPSSRLPAPGSSSGLAGCCSSSPWTRPPSATPSRWTTPPSRAPTNPRRASTRNWMPATSCSGPRPKTSSPKPPRRPRTCAPSCSRAATSRKTAKEVSEDPTAKTNRAAWAGSRPAPWSSPSRMAPWA